MEHMVLTILNYIYHMGYELVEALELITLTGILVFVHMVVIVTFYTG